MALINAVITNKENTLVTELPKDYLSIYEELCSIGSRKALERIPLTDNEEDDIGSSSMRTVTSAIICFSC